MLSERVVMIRPHFAQNDKNSNVTVNGTMYSTVSSCDLTPLNYLSAAGGT